MRSIENHEDKSGSSWARKVFVLEVGGIGLRISSKHPSLRLQVKEATQRFLTSDVPVEVEVTVRWGSLRPPSSTSLIFDSGGVWQLHRDLENRVFHLTSPRYGTTPYKRATFNSNFTFGEVLLDRNYFDPHQPVDALEYPLDELLMMNLLAQGRGVEVHACGIQDTNGKGYIFLGHSGTGKTTIARLWEKVRDVEVLSDDRIILRPGAGKIWMYGTPWHGDAGLSSSTRTAVSEIFFLGRGQMNEIVIVGRTEAVARLMACSFVPFYCPAGLDRTIAFFQQVTDQIPYHELRFLPTTDVVKFVKRSTG